MVLGRCSRSHSGSMKRLRDSTGYQPVGVSQRLICEMWPEMGDRTVGHVEWTASRQIAWGTTDEASSPSTLDDGAGGLGGAAPSRSSCFSNLLTAPARSASARTPPSACPDPAPSPGTRIDPASNVTERHAEPHRHGLRLRVHALDDRQRRRLERLFLAAIERDERHERPHGRGAALIGLQKHVACRLLRLNTRVTLGTSFCPSWTSGLTASRWRPCLTGEQLIAERHAAGCSAPRS